MSKVLSFLLGHSKIMMRDVKMIEIIKIRGYFLLICLIAGIVMLLYSRYFQILPLWCCGAVLQSCLRTPLSEQALSVKSLFLNDSFKILSRLTFSRAVRKTNFHEDQLWLTKGGTPDTGAGGTCPLRAGSDGAGPGGTGRAGAPRGLRA